MGISTIFSRSTAGIPKLCSFDLLLDSRFVKALNIQEPPSNSLRVESHHRSMRLIYPDQQQRGWLIEEMKQSMNN
jgi:hypothetical protein